MKKMALYAIALTLSVSSCTTYTATGAAFGGVIGSAVGGLAGGPRGSDIGTLVGVATGAVVGAAADARQQEEAARRQMEYERRRQQNYDDVYAQPGSQRYYSNSDDEKARRIRQYHENVERKYGGNGFSYDLAHKLLIVCYEYATHVAGIFYRHPCGAGFVGTCSHAAV